MLVQYKPNEILAFPEESSLNTLITDQCPAESNESMQLLCVWHLYQTEGPLNKLA